MLGRFQQFLNSESIMARLSKGSFAGVLIAVLGAVLTLFSQILLTRYMGAYAYGHFVLVVAWVHILVILSFMGSDGMALKHVSIYRSRKDWRLLRGLLHTTNLFPFASGCIVGISLALFVLIFECNGDMALCQTFLIAALLIPLRTSVMIKVMQLRGYQKVIGAFLPDVVARVIIFIAFITLFDMFAPISLNAPTAMALYLMAHIIVLGAYFWQYKVTFSNDVKGVEPDFSELKKWAGMAIFFGLTALMNILLRRTDTVMIGALLDPVTVGVYGAVTNITGFLLMGYAMVNTVFGPMASALYDKGNMKGLWRSFHTVRILLFTGYSAGAIILYFFGEWVLGLYGREFIVGHQAMVVLACWWILSSYFGCSVFMASMTKMHKQATVFASVAVLFNIGLNYFMIKEYGIIGAAHATGASWLLYQGSIYFYLKRYLKAKEADV